MTKYHFSNAKSKTLIPDFETLTDFEVNHNSGNIVLAIAGLSMGDGDTELGKQLMLDLINDLPRQDNLPQTIVFYNAAVNLACEDSEIISSLQFLEAQEIDILVCKKSLDYFKLKQSLSVGKPATIQEINSCFLNADYLIRP